MGRLTIRIPHVAPRPRIGADGRVTYRPRFEPGAPVRALGYRGEDLKHPDGRWFSLEEAIAWAEARDREIADRRERRAAGKRLRPVARSAGYTLEDLFEDYWKSPKFTGAAQPEGHMQRRGLAPATRRDYRAKVAVLAAFDPDVWLADIRSLTPAILYGLHEKLWIARGHHMANGIMAVLRLALSYARKKGRITVNPALRLELETPPVRLRVGTFAEMRALVAAADAQGCHEVGDAIMLGLFTGQRLADRLAMLDAGAAEDGMRRLRQSKTGAVVQVPDAPALATRLAAARQRRDDMKTKVANIVVNPRTKRAHDGSSYNKRFRLALAAALEEAPTLAGFQDRDLRDTAVTWLADAGCTVPEICAITGHDEQSAYKVLKHYLARSPEQAQRAIAKLVAHLDSRGAGL